MKKKYVLSVLLWVLCFGLFAQEPDLCVTGGWAGRYVYAGEVNGFPSWSFEDKDILVYGETWMIADDWDLYIGGAPENGPVGPYYDSSMEIFAYVDYCDGGGGGETNVYTNCVSVVAIDWSGEGMRELLVALVAPWAIFGFLFGLAFIGFFARQKF